MNALVSNPCHRNIVMKNKTDEVTKDDDMTMMPVAQCVSPLNCSTQQPTGEREYENLPVAACVGTINENATANSPLKSQDVKVEVLTDDSDSFDTPSAQSFVTEENQQANVNLIAGTITGHDLLARLKDHRKKATTKNAMIGGVIGFLFLGPIGALGVGAGTAAVVKHRLKKKEKSLRRQLDGRLDRPLQILRRLDCDH